MASFYPFGRLHYSDYVQGEYYVRDITGAVKLSGDETAKTIARYGKLNLAATALQTFATLASDEALRREFGCGFDAVNRTLEWGLDVLSQGLDSVRSSIEDLNASFGYNIGLVIAQLQVQNQQLLGVVERLDAIHKTLENPALTQAREFYRTGCERLERGLLDKALEAFHKSEEKNDTDYLTELQIGRLYLYGRDEDDNVVDLERARRHLLLAAKYGRAEVAFLPAAVASVAESHLHAAIACYLLAGEATLAGDKPESDKLLDESIRLALDAAKLRPKLGEAHYQAATGLALLARPDEAAASLEQAIAVDRRYSLNAADDPNFASMRDTVATLLERLRADALARSTELLAEKRREIDSLVYIGEKAQSVRRELETRLGKAEQMVARATLFDSQDAVRELDFSSVSGAQSASATHEPTTLTGHTEGVYPVAFSPDGCLLASGSDDDTIKLWDVRERRELATLKGHTDSAYSVVFSPDGRLLASGSRDKTVKLWDAHERRELTMLKGHTNAVNSVAFSPDGCLLASGSMDKTVKLWNVRGRCELTALTGHAEGVTSVAFSPDGCLLASGSFDHNVKLWDVRKRRELATLTGHTGWVHSVAFSPDGCLLASGSSDKTLKLWDVRERRVLTTLTGHAEGVGSVAFSPDGCLLASGSSDKTLKLWGVCERRELTTLTGHTKEVLSAAFSPDGCLLASGSYDNTVKLWDVLAQCVVSRVEWERVQAARRVAEASRIEQERKAREEREAAEATRREREAQKLREERRAKGLCINCGAKLGFARRLGGHATCSDCEAKRDA